MKRSFPYGGSLFALLLVSCLKGGEFETAYILKPSVQYQSVDPAEPLAGVIAYGYEVDTLDWGIASYDDAAAGIITRKDDPSQQLTEPAEIAVPYDGTADTAGADAGADAGDGGDGGGNVDRSTWLQLSLGSVPRMIVVVDPATRLYGYTMQQPLLNLPRLYVSVVFLPWKEGYAYKNGAWSFYNDFYTPPIVLKAYYKPTWQAEAEGEESAFTSSQVKAYAYAADTTDWYIASYDDAVAGKITRKDGSEERTTPNFQAYYENDSGTYGMEVTATPLMAVVVDRLNRIYAYTKFVPDLEGPSPTWPVVFRPWRTEGRYKENDWCMVNDRPAPETQTANR